MEHGGRRARISDDGRPWLSGRRAGGEVDAMVNFLLFLILAVLCWPLALAALVLYPLIWLLLLPFRILGVAVGGVLELIGALIALPGRMLRGVLG